jgi:cytochrome c oxidase assembly protein subunit 15
LAALQATLGIATLMSRAPLALALPHQCFAAIVLAAALAFAWRVRRA